MRAINWHSKSQQAVNTRAMTDRFKNNWVFLNMPNFNEFTKSMRMGNIIFRAIIPYRTKLYARVLIQRKSRNWRSDDPWGDDQANKRYNSLEKRYGEISNELILKTERSLPNTVMDFIVPNLELILLDVTQEYERLKLDSRKTEEKAKFEGRKDAFKDKYMLLLKKVSRLLVNNELNLGKVRVTKQEIANSLGISPMTLNKYLSISKQDTDEPKKGDGI